MGVRNILKRIEALLRARSAYKFFLKDWISLKDIHRLDLALSSVRFTRNLDPIVLEFPPSCRSIVVVAPHPDDEILGCGGTLIKAIAAGCEVTVVYVTDGNPPVQCAEEAREVAATIGYRARFLGFPANNIPLDSDSLSRFVSAVIEAQPDVIFIPFLADDHDDHRRVSEMLWKGFEGYTGNLLKKPLWAYQVYSVVFPNVVVDISGVIDKKVSAVRMWKTQHTRDWGHYVRGMNAYNSRYINTDGRPAYCETYFSVPLGEYIDLCAVYFESSIDAYYGSSYRNDRQ